jgi:hypothetical protein
MKKQKLFLAKLAGAMLLLLMVFTAKADEQVYLSNLNWVSATIGWGTIHRDLSVDGNTLRLNGTPYEKGIGTHAVSSIIYAFDGACTHFQAYVGVDDEVPGNNNYASVEFMVYADGELVFSSGTMGSTTATQFIDLDITGVDTLELYVSDVNNSNNSDHADWADAQVTVTGTLPPETIRFRAPVSFNSSSEQLNEMFAWAKDRAYSFVQTGDGNNIPSYWAGLLERPAFYLRDVAHQALGAHFLELDEENYTMIRTFALSATQNRKYYPIWAFTFQGTIYYLDYHNDNDFVREVPQAFEMTEQAYNMYRWTGDQNYIEDPDMMTFYENSVTGFVEQHDENNNGIADDNWSQEGNIFKGVATYNEQSTDNFIEAADGMAAQYRAYLAYADLLLATDDTAGYDTWTENAAHLRDKFATDWYQAGQYARGMKIDDTYGTGFAQMHIMYPPRAGLTDMAERNAAALDMLYAHYQSIYFVEARSYHAETYFKYNQVERAWEMMNNVYDDNRRNYPEISFVLVANCIAGVMGLNADIPHGKVITVPRLPEEIEWAEVDSVKAGNQYIYVKHEENARTTFTNKSEEPLNWQASFYGGFTKLKHNGNPEDAQQTTLNGQQISFLQLEVQPGQTEVVEVDSMYVALPEHSCNRQQLIFPNPAADKITVQVGSGTTQLNIYNITGTFVKSVEVNGKEEVTVDVSGLPAGEYFVRWIEENRPQSRLFVKK